MFEWVQSQIVSFVYAIVIIAMSIVALIFGVRASGGSRFIGWTAGIVSLVVMIFLFRPLTEALSDKACELNSEKCE